MPAAGLAPLPLAAELELLGGDGRYQREISHFWSFADNRVFGGYAAALTLSACAVECGLSTILSCHAMFVDALRPAPLRIQVETLKRGRSTAAVRATALQDETPKVVADAWLTEELFSESASVAPELVLPTPDSCPEITFRAEALPFMGVMAERAIDYPESAEDFHSGPPTTDVWARPRMPSSPTSLPLSQLFDVMVLDAHVLDAALRVRRRLDVTTASLDLTVLWHQVLDFDRWRRVRTESGSIESAFVATTGTITDDHGRPVAEATQLGKVRRRSRPNGVPEA